MAKNLDALAEVVRLTMKAALAPEQAKSALLSQALTEARAELGSLRERLAILEARAARRRTPAEPDPVAADPVAPDPVVTLQ